MLSFINNFSNRKAFEWFVVITIGIMIRPDLLGATSVVRAMAISGSSYANMIHFFRSSAWNLSCLRSAHCNAVKREIPLFRHSGRIVLAADGSKQSKEARRMPGVKKYKQESETQSKPAMMFGHLWGCVGVLTEVNGGITSTPVSMKLHGGLKGMETWSAWKDYGFSVASHVVQILNDACETADRFAEDCVVLLDRYHLTVPAMKALIAHNSSDKRKSFVYVIIKAKRSAVGYHLPMPKEKSKRGPQKKRGDKVRLWELFDSDIDKFKEVKLELYGKERTVSCYTIDLLWGKGINTMLRFVLSKLDSGEKSLFVTNDLTLSAEDVIYYIRSGRKLRLASAL